MQIVNLETIIDMQSWCRILATQWIPVVSVLKQKLLRKHKKGLQKFLELTRKPKVICTDNSLKFDKTYEDLSWNHCTSTPHRSACRKSSAQSERKHMCSIVAIRSGWKLVGRFLGMQNLSSKHSRWRFGEPFKGPIVPFGSLVWVFPCNCERSVKNRSIWKENLTCIDPRIRIVRGRNLEGWRTDRRPWGVGDDGRIRNLLKKTQCEIGDFHKENGEFIFPTADGRIKLSLVEIRTWEHPPWYGSDPLRGESQ